MAVTKETYSATATWTASDLADMFRDAFIDAGLMTAWYDSFSVSSTLYRVLKIEHDGTKAYGSSFYSFSFSLSGASQGVYLNLASGWNPSGTPPVNVPTGTQYLDYYSLPASQPSGTLILNPSATSNVFLDRYTSGDDAKQSWFVLRGLSGASVVRSKPFTILHKDTVLHSWLDLDKGIISGAAEIVTYSGFSNQTYGFVRFTIPNLLRRSLVYGAALRGKTANSGFYSSLSLGSHFYFGAGNENNPAFLSSSIPNAIVANSVDAGGGGVGLPVGRSSTNPAFITDYIPICSDLPWSPWTPTKLADDFGIYMHYADNTVDYGDRFIVQSGLNEWQILAFANNSNVITGASATFLARIV